MESVLCSSACLKELEELYTEAFPANERMPFSQMLSLSKDDRYALRALKDDGAFCGFSFIMRHEEMIYLFYLAVRQDQRGKGYGSALLDDLFQQYLVCRRCAFELLLDTYQLGWRCEGRV